MARSHTNGPARVMAPQPEGSDAMPFSLDKHRQQMWGLQVRAERVHKETEQTWSRIRAAIAENVRLRYPVPGFPGVVRSCNSQPETK
jgi:hypothetical protein